MIGYWNSMKKFLKRSILSRDGLFELLGFAVWVLLVYLLKEIGIWYYYS